MSAVQGYRQAVQDIARWHTEQGRAFSDTAAKLERDKAKQEDILRATWASVSHHAHAAYIVRRFWPPEAGAWPPRRIGIPYTQKAPPEGSA